ncbi:MAG: hypothetical protein P4M08_09760 [Oligoflexia bacterium]|nr:hypothetical protein [Oligoflexia bacterium]
MPDRITVYFQKAKGLLGFARQALEAFNEILGNYFFLFFFLRNACFLSVERFERAAKKALANSLSD